ncbi:MAG: hypothetical protein UR34_C0010G0023 [candidate division WS6 bacterium GW2011_GWC1_33_20]|uniref:Uncharacterized protein n=1 Tax=candidate division WS6 bacterium GW2011_GWC1_33_20 TaxID=1619089 RepID=A0A0F9ZI58_9BACT|nr:MAG: hypothetical protein UR32_C0019G0015 [candidate division WS6 bacterium GW2011_GWE2_33_157]KKP43858.1 MAG: hypothetical protein UR34_C0010G0023 [candidate division WS6 bacterium GW2011_GWC1_33_20]KKP44351.1 MAG: hypothetical protein UR36_C0018G0016 [candidate division WS6 bacterium GW2011_GWF1_33_233]KKP54836.1 MAG: hypothetical protein UR45_C0008G0014 [candidate division WS6 bacterium GW2011_WS6_33_547]KKP55838.1 MAG: hypothetical protein UR49_C0027G0004 [candidate division WS6 bacteriu
MKKVLIVITVIILLITQIQIINANGISKLSGNSLKAHLYLYGSNNEFAKMTYNKAGQYFEYILNAHHLLPNTKYILLYYPQKTIGLLCIGYGTSNNAGGLNISEKEIDITSIPFNIDINGSTNTTTYENGITGGKIWLVLSNEVNCPNMHFLTPTLTNALYEDTLIYYWKW